MIDKHQITGRRRARTMALQALYQWMMTEADLIHIEAEFHNVKQMDKVDTEYFHELLHQIPQFLSEIDAAFEPYLDRKITELNPIELIAIRIATYELGHRLDIPYKVAINEALDLTKKFGTVTGFKYVNGIVDRVAKKLRPGEIEHRKSQNG